MTTPATPHPDVRARALATLRAETIEKVRELAEARKMRRSAEEERLEMERQLFETPAYSAAQSRSMDAMNRIAILESSIKALALDAYHADPANKKPAPGLGIRVTLGVEYDAAVAREWCSDKGLFIIPESVDEKALNKFLLTNESPITLDYTVTETPTVTIAKDLDAALKGEG